MAQANLEHLQVQITISKTLEVLVGSVDLIKIRIHLVHFMNSKPVRDKELKNYVSRELISKDNKNMRSNILNRVEVKSQATLFTEIKMEENTMNSKVIQGSSMRNCFENNKKHLDSRKNKIKLRLTLTKVVVITNMMISLNKVLQNKSKESSNSNKLKKKKTGKTNTIKVHLSNGKNPRTNSITILYDLKFYNFK